MSFLEVLLGGSFYKACKGSKVGKRGDNIYFFVEEKKNEEGKTGKYLVEEKKSFLKFLLGGSLYKACKGSKVGKHGDNEVAGANIEGQHFVPKRQTLSPIYALAKILKEYMR